MSPSTRSSALAFAAGEYLALWRDHGLDELTDDPSGLAACLEARWTSPEAEPASPRTGLLIVADSAAIEQGPEGELLGRILQSIAVSRETVRIAPISGELDALISAARPRVVVAMGSRAAAQLTGSSASLATLRGRVHAWVGDQAVPVVATFPPDHLLRHPDAKRACWEDMKRVKALLESPR